MNPTVGSIQYDASIKLDQLKRDSKQAESIAKNTGDEIGSGMERGSGRATAALGKMAKFAAVSAVAVGVAFTAAVSKFVIGGGISRALNIEDAQAKLRGLGHEAESVSKVMDSALAAVKGTAFGLDAAATIAASAVAAGVESGEDLTKYLGLTADAATIAGTSLSEMGSIFNKVQTGQRAYTMELNQLADRGIPIYQWLQEELGLSQEALRDMVSAGELDSATYFKVIEKNIGGAALESGKTTRGAWANMQAAMSRVGAAIVKDIIPRVRNSFGSMTKWFDDNSNNIVTSVGKAMESLKNLAGSAVDLAKEIAGYLGPRISRLKEALLDLFPTIKTFSEVYLRPLASLIGTTLVVGFGAAVDALTVFTNMLRPVFNWLNSNKIAVTGLVTALATLYAAMKIRSGFLAVDAALMAMRASFIGQTIATVGLSKAIGAAGIAFKGFLVSIGPVGWVIGAISVAAGLLSMAWARNSQEADRLKAAQDRLKAATDALKSSKDRLREAELGVEGAQIRLERAQINAKKATEEYGAESLEAREASLELKRAVLELKTAHDDAATATDTHKEAEEEYAKSGGLIESAEGKMRAMQGLADILGRTVVSGPVQAQPSPAGTTHPSFRGAGLPSWANPGNNYMGTDNWRGGPTWVHEKGPEIIDLPKGTRIIPHELSKEMMGSGSGIENNIGTINIASEADGEKWLRKLTKNQEITSSGLTPVQGLM